MRWVAALASLASDNFNLASTLFLYLVVLAILCDLTRVFLWKLGK